MADPILLSLLCLGFAAAAIVLRRLRHGSSGKDRRLDAIRHARFEARPVMNRSELRFFQILNDWLRRHARSHHVAPQVTYGAFLGSRDGTAWRLVASKRADFVIFDRQGRVCLIVEFDGPGHHGRTPLDARNALDRDRQKDLAAAQAGIPLLRLASLDNREALAQALRLALAPSDPHPKEAPLS